MNRAAVYWIPVVFLWAKFRHLSASHADVGSILEVLGTIGMALSYVLICEIFFFGFRVALFPDRMIYRSTGFPIFRERTIYRQSIARWTHEAKMRADHLPWRFVRLELHPGESRKSIVVNLTSFSAADGNRVLRWLEGLPGGGL